MTRLFDILKRKRNARRLLAAGLLVIAFVDIASHAITTADTETRDLSAWCVKYHYENSGVDCPHKRDHRAPDKSAFDDMGHSAVLQPAEEVQISGIVYRSELPAPQEIRTVTRPLEPPTQPPKQV